MSAPDRGAGAALGLLGEPSTIGGFSHHNVEPVFEILVERSP
jgi:hypothetical protein